MLNKKVGLIALLVCVAASDLFAGTFASYAIGDVLVCFRRSGGALDLVVDAGPISTFTNVAPNTRITITQYTTNQLYKIGSLNNLTFSAFTWVDNTVPATLRWTVFMSQARDSLNVQSDPWSQRQLQNAQQILAGDMGSVKDGAVTTGITTVYTNASSATAVINPDDTTGNNPNYALGGQSYDYTIGTDFNFRGDFVGIPENTTPANFITGSTVVRSDFFMLIPKINGVQPGSATFLGYFELNTNGVMTYVAYPTGIPTVPVITSITRTNTTSYISFTTGTFGTYTLRGTNSSGLTAPRTNWPAITSTAGNGSVNTLQDTTSVSDKFYVITAQ